MHGSNQQRTNNTSGFKVSRQEEIKSHTFCYLHAVNSYYYIFALFQLVRVFFHLGENLLFSLLYYIQYSQLQPAGQVLGANAAKNVRGLHNVF